MKPQTNAIGRHEPELKHLGQRPTRLMRRALFLIVGLVAIALIVAGVLLGNLDRIHQFSAQI